MRPWGRTGPFELKCTSQNSALQVDFVCPVRAETRMRMEINTRFPKLPSVVDWAGLFSPEASTHKASAYGPCQSSCEKHYISNHLMASIFSLWTFTNGSVSPVASYGDPNTVISVFSLRSPLVSTCPRVFWASGFTFQVRNELFFRTQLRSWYAFPRLAFFFFDGV